MAFITFHRLSASRESFACQFMAHAPLPPGGASCWFYINQRNTVSLASAPPASVCDIATGWPTHSALPTMQSQPFESDSRHPSCSTASIPGPPPASPIHSHALFALLSLSGSAGMLWLLCVRGRGDSVGPTRADGWRGRQNDQTLGSGATELARYNNKKEPAPQTECLKSR